MDFFSFLFIPQQYKAWANTVHQRVKKGEDYQPSNKKREFVNKKTSVHIVPLLRHNIPSCFLGGTHPCYDKAFSHSCMVEAFSMRKLPIRVLLNAVK